MTSDLRSLLQDIYDRHGKLTPELVREEARSPESPLHSRFEWDDGVAAEAWRLDQAHKLIQSVKVVYRKGQTGDLHEVRAFHAVRTPDAITYEPVDRIVRDEFMSKLVMGDMQRAWRDLKRRFEVFEEFWALVRDDMEGRDAA